MVIFFALVYFNRNKAASRQCSMTVRIVVNIVRLESLMKKVMLVVGIIGVIVMYGGFLYFFFSGVPTAALPWFLLICPWVCIYFGLTKTQQIASLSWLKNKFTFTNK